MEESDICAICLESLAAKGQGRQRLSCGHLFHELCVLHLRRYGVSDRCPLCCSACSDLRSAQDLMSKAALCHSRRQFAEARNLLDEVLTIEPNHGRAMNMLGALFMEGLGVERNGTVAFQLFEKSCSAGNLEAVNNLGNMYHHGEGVEKNARKARELYEEARRAGVCEAAVSLGTMYRVGEGVERNAMKACELYEEARRAGIARAALNLGLLYQTGDGVEKNAMKARELYEEARFAGDHSAAFSLGCMYQEGEGVERNAKKARELYEEARRAGIARAAFNLGILYQTGEGVEKNAMKACELYEEARRAGDHQAAVNLGHMYQTGDGVEKNAKKACELYEEARRAGVCEAAVCLGNMYLVGDGVEKNAKKACELYEEARRAGVREAAFSLALMYTLGEGMERNAKKARELYEEARRAGFPKAALNLGLLYQTGEGVERNAMKACELYEEARRAGVHEGALNLGHMYLVGEGVEKNATKARELYEEARRAGVPKAALNLGLLYQTGDGVEKNAMKARELYEEARRAGVHGAARVLGMLYLEGQGIKKDFGKAKALFEEAYRDGDAVAAHHVTQLLDLDFENKLEEGNKSTSSGQTQSGTSIPRPSRPSCAACGAEGRFLKLCTGCRRAWYCSVHCQRQHRGVHKDICRQSWPGTGQVMPPQPCDPEAEVSKPASSESVAPTPFSRDLTPWKCQASDDYAAAAAASLDEMDAHAAMENGQIADAILRSRCAASAVSGVVLLEFSRDPRSFHDSLRNCLALKEYCDALEKAGAASELPSLAKVYVPPEIYDATMEAVRIFGLELQARHVIAWPGIEKTVTDAAESRAEKVKLQGRAVIPLGLAGASLQADAKIEVTHTFVHTKIPSSLCSEHSGPVTASTTDAHCRFGQNVRTHVSREARSSADV